MPVTVLSLRSETLPPATHTNCIFVSDHQGFVVVDPGSPFETENRVLIEAVQQRQQSGYTFLGAVLTHRHRDHVSGVLALVAATGCTVFAHPTTALEVRPKIHVDRYLDEGDELVSMRVLFTPGHARGHICLFGITGGVNAGEMVVGDMVAGVGSILIAAPDGDMAEYLRSLERMKALKPSRLYPAHGPIIGNPDEKLSIYLKHRRWREQLLLQAIRDGQRNIEEIVASAYFDTDKALWPLASLAARAHLLHLEQQGLIVRLTLGKDEIAEEQWSVYEQ